MTWYSCHHRTRTHIHTLPLRSSAITSTLRSYINFTQHPLFPLGSLTCADIQEQLPTTFPPTPSCLLAKSQTRKTLALHCPSPRFGSPKGHLLTFPSSRGCSAGEDPLPVLWPWKGPTTDWILPTGMLDNGKRSPRHIGKRRPRHIGKRNPKHIGKRSPEHIGKRRPETR